jgi:hypothetical protein
MQLLVDVDLSTMADCCSAVLGFGGITHGDSDGEPTGSASSRINGKHSNAKDGLGGVAHGVSNGETIGGTNVVRNTGHQDDVVAPQLASVALPIGMATVKPTAVPTVMM